VPHPTRRAILTRLAEGEATVAELAAPFSVSQPAVSKHLKVLEHAGLVSRTRRATARLSRLEAEPLREVTTWLARYQRFWDERHERLDDLLATLQAEGAPGHVALQTVTFTERGGRTLARTVSAFQSVQDRDAMVASGMERGVRDSGDRLDELLANLQASEPVTTQPA
jgi:DNA-binding transcriptional ArsR family regulator